VFFWSFCCTGVMTWGLEGVPVVDVVVVVPVVVEVVAAVVFGVRTVSLVVFAALPPEAAALGALATFVPAPLPVLVRAF
jgi:hypothetical protein